jgi:tetratricopeptide (TPR) repeat protein
MIIRSFLVLPLLLFGYTIEAGEINFTNIKCIEGGNQAIIKDDSDSYPFYNILPLGIIWIYQKFIGPVKGYDCPMYPSCSVYAYEAFKRYNFIKALVLTTDRLHRDRHDLDKYEKVFVSGSVKFYDPVEISTIRALNIPSHFALYLLNDIDTTRLSNDSAEDVRLFRFANMLEMKGDYERAITEYYRLIFYFPKSPYSKLSAKSILNCYYKTEQYLSAVRWGMEILEKGLAEDEYEVNLLIGASFLKLENIPRAREYFDVVISGSKNNDLKDKSILLKGFSFAIEDRWDEAEKIFTQVSLDSRFYSNAKRSIEICQRAKRIPKKNPYVAGFLGIIPGLGYLYSGYKQTAVASFIVNGLLMWGTIKAFKQGNEGLGIMLAFITGGFYSGNIYGSIVTAKRANEEAKKALLLKFDLGF